MRKRNARQINIHGKNQISRLDVAGEETLLAHASVFAHLLRDPGWHAVSFIWSDKRLA